MANLDFTNMNIVNNNENGQRPRMVNLRSMVNKTIVVKIPEYGINRKWTNKGQIIPVPYTIMEQLMWHNGFKNMIDRGILYIDNLQDKIDLGIEPIGSTKPSNIIVLNDEEIKECLTTMPFDTFTKKVESLNKTQVDNIINYILANEIVDVAKCTFLKELTNIDTINIIHQRKDAELAEKKAAAMRAYEERER